MKTVLFLCTGNTCRSPMAACLFTAYVKQHHIPQMTADSAGLCAQQGSPASVGARRAMERRGLSLQNHRSKGLSMELLTKADLIVGMSASHIAPISTAFPFLREKLCFFDDPPITDPYGGDDMVYEQAATDLSRQIPALYAQLMKD